MKPGEPLRLNAGIAGKSGRRKLCIVDWDGDGTLDMLLNSANANVLRQTHAADGKWAFQGHRASSRRQTSRAMT